MWYRRAGSELTDGDDSLKKRARVKAQASSFKGVTLHCRTNRFESHIWEEGKQIYLGGFASEQVPTPLAIRPMQSCIQKQRV